MAIKDIIKTLLPVKSDLQRIHGELSQTKQALEKLRLERDEVQAAPLTRENVQEWLFYGVDKKAEKYPEALLRRHAPLNNHPCTAPGEENIRDQDFSMAPCFPVTNLYNGNEPGLKLAGLEWFICYAFKNEVKAAISRALDEQDWSQSGMARDARIKRLAQLDAQIAEVEKDLNDFEQIIISMRNNL